MQAPMQQAIPPPGVQGQYGPAPGSGYPPQGYPQPQNMGVNPQGGYPTQARTAAVCMHHECEAYFIASVHDVCTKLAKQHYPYLNCSGACSTAVSSM